MLTDDDVGLRDIAADGWFNAETGELAPGFVVRRGERILDIGCGDGLMSPFCARQGAKLVLADIDADKLGSVKAALSGFGPDCAEYLLTDANPLPLEDGSVDKIIASEVMEHVEKLDDFVRELMRVAKPGAQFLVSAPSEISERLQKDLAPPSYFEAPNHIRIFEAGELVRLLTRHGLIVERVASRGFYNTMWWMLFWACGQDVRPPWHPLLRAWNSCWARLLDTADGARIKRIFDDALPKSVTVVAHKPV
jgi:SAM-dependent methyltransferase